MPEHREMITDSKKYSKLNLLWKIELNDFLMIGNYDVFRIFI